MLELAYGVLGGLAWANFVVGGLTVVVGLLGLHAGCRPSLGAAKRVRRSPVAFSLDDNLFFHDSFLQYFWALILVAVVMVGVMVAYIIVVDRSYWIQLCEQEPIDVGNVDDCTSDATRWLFVVAAIVQLFITIFCCVGSSMSTGTGVVGSSCVKFVSAQTCCVGFARNYYKVLAKEDGTFNPDLFPAVFIASESCFRLSPCGGCLHITIGPRAWSLSYSTDVHHATPLWFAFDDE